MSGELTFRIFNEIAKVFVAPKALFAHAPEYGNSLIYIIVNKYLPFFRM